MDRDAIRRYVARLDEASNRPLVEQLEEELAPMRGLSDEQIAATVKSVCSAAMKIIDSRPDRERAMAYQDPVPPESAALWRRLVKATAAARRSKNGRG